MFKLIEKNPDKVYNREYQLKIDEFSSDCFMSSDQTSNTRSPIDLEEFVDKCWNSHSTIDFKRENSSEPQDNLILTKPFLEDSGTSSLNYEDQYFTLDQDSLLPCKSQISVKNMVQHYTQYSNGHLKFEFEREKWYLVVRELIETEKVYLKSLVEVEDGYLKVPNRLFNDCQEVATIFSNWKKLREFHSNFLNHICSVKPYDFNGLQRLSECFNDEVDQFETLYTEYCTNYLQSVKYLHHIEVTSSITWKNLIQCQTELGHQLPLSTFLLKPVQRILKYHLMLKELIQCYKLSQHTKSSEIMECLLNAFQNMVQVANRINERQMEREEQIRRLHLRDELYSDMISAMLNCPELGKPYLDGELKVPGCKNSRLVLLCQNAMILAKRLGTSKWDIKQVIKCNQMMLFEYIPKQPLEFHVVDIQDNKNKATLQALSHEDKETWCKMIKQLIISTFETDSISERAKRILLDKKSNVLAQNQSSNKDVLDKFYISLKCEDDLLDYESSCRRMLDPISSPFFISKSKSIQRRNSVGAIKSESKINFRDPSIYQWSTRKHFYNDDIDCRSIMIDVNEESLCERDGQEKNQIGKEVNEKYKSHINKSKNEVYISEATTKTELLLQPLLIKAEAIDNSNILIGEMELASLCSEPDLDSVASDTTTNNQHRRKSTSMDRNFSTSLYAKANSFTNSIDNGNPSGEFINSSHRKMPLFSSVRETKSTRSNSDWGSLFDMEIKSGLVKKFFKASVKLAKRDKNKLHLTPPLDNNNIKTVNPSSPCKSTTNSESKRFINKSNSIDHIVQSSNCLQRTNSSKKNNIVQGSISPVNSSNEFESQIEDSDRPIKPPRQLSHFRIEMFDKMNTLSNERLKINAYNNKVKVTSKEPISHSQSQDSPNLGKVKDLVSMFQSDI